MRLRLHLPVAALLVVLSPTGLSADWFVSPFLGVRFAGQTSFVDPEEAVGIRKWTPGVSGGLLGLGMLGFEVDLAHLPGFFQSPTQDPETANVTGSGVTTLMGNVMLAAPGRWTEYSLRPYGSAGLGLMRLRREGLAFPLRLNTLGLNVGGGAIGFLSAHVGLRWDLRHFRYVAGQDEATFDGFGEPRLSYWRLNMGLVVRY
jgi:hypothetical protein